MPRVVRVYYTRPGQSYEDWALHVWGEAAEEETTWEKPMLQTGQTSDGVFFDVQLSMSRPDAALGLLVHRGDEKSAGGQLAPLPPGATEVWLADGCEAVLMDRESAVRRCMGSLSRCCAHWVNKDTVLLYSASGTPAADGKDFWLLASASAQLTIADVVEGADVTARLMPIANPDNDTGCRAALRKFPHLANCLALRLEATNGLDLRTLVSAQLAVVCTGEDGTVESVTGVQLAGVLDDRFCYDGPLGWADGSVSVWAPTAHSVKLLVFDAPRGGEPQAVEMAVDSQGCWSAPFEAAWERKYYLYEVTVYHQATQRVETVRVTDPYSRGLCADGERSMFVDLDGDVGLMPEGWREHASPAIAGDVDTSVYELHVRDFSASDSTVPAALRGKYLAFDARATSKQTLGQAHLARLSAAGLTHVHLLPTYDFGSVPERPEAQREPPSNLNEYGPDSEVQQREVMRVASADAFNWGYDPVHYGVPEGSYATDPDTAARVPEYRAMVQALHGMGLRVVQDVVYNHTYASGLDRYSVLDRVVPGYYHRRDPNGDVCNSTCCNNTATEHRMCERLMIDDLVHWASHYRIDGFRFDIMGHIMVDSMRRARKALDALTVETHGVDGSSVYLYGEAWDFGEVACNQRGRNACQVNITGTGLGAFNDRLRDAALGGSPFSPPTLQGFLTGLHIAPNPSAPPPSPDSLHQLLYYADLLRVGMAGNLRDYKLQTASGAVQRGVEVPYGPVPAAYCASPAENVVYLGCHDNETLFDTVVMKLAHGGDGAAVARTCQMALALTAVSQGVAFFHAGDDLLRSKSLDRDSYNSGDWFNRLDWSGAHNNFGVGLPPANKNAETWPLKRKLLGTTTLVPSPTVIAETHKFFQAMLRLRYSSPLFRLRTGAAVMQQVSFANCGPEQVPGLVVMVLESAAAGAGGVYDPCYERIVVAINARPEATAVEYPPAAQRLTLHPETAALPHVQGTTCDDGERTATVRPRTLAVLVEPRA